MPTRVEQTAAMDAGQVRLTCLQPTNLDPATLEIGMARLDRGTPHFLDPLAKDEPFWVAGERWFKPENARLEGNLLTFMMGPALTWRMKPHAAYLLHLRDGSGGRLEDRLAWPPVRLPSTPPDPQPADPIPASAAPAEPVEDDLAAFATMAAEAPPEPVAAVEPAPLAPAPEPRLPPGQPTSGRSYILPILLVLLLLLAAGGGAYWWYFMRGESETPQAEKTDTPPPAKTEPPTPPPASDIALTLESARSYITEKKPSAEDAAKQAKRFADAGQSDAAFLLYRRAAQEGDVGSMLTIAKFYDPQSFKAGQSPVTKADPDQASSWYEKAGNAGNLEAMQRLSSLLKDPQVTRPDAAERATFWSQKASEAAAKASQPATNGNSGGNANGNGATP